MPRRCSWRGPLAGDAVRCEGAACAPSIAPEAAVAFLHVSPLRQVTEICSGARCYLIEISKPTPGKIVK